MKKHLLFAAMLMLSAAPAVAAPAASAPYFAADETPEDVATQLINDITESIAAWEKQIAQGKVDFPDYDWKSAQEFVVDYWAGVKKDLTENPSSYTDADLAELVDEFSEAKKQNFLVIAQCEIWSGDYNAKYFPVYQKISNARVTLSEECPTVADTYIPQLDDLDGEMGNALLKLNEGEVESQEDFDKMLARVDEISTEVDKILEEAKAAEAIATGINGITAETAAKAGKVYTIDGKRVNSAKNGLNIINGKKVVVKK